MKFALWAVAGMCLSGTAFAQDAKTVVQTSFGVPVTKWSNDFANHFEYASPDVNFTIPRGFSDQEANVTLVKDGANVVGPHILVVVAYTGDWQFFNSAVFRGGEPIAFKESTHNVLGCSGGCTMTESFYLTPTKEQLAKYGKDGSLTLQIQSKTATNAIITIPMSYYAAVQEAAK